MRANRARHRPGRGRPAAGLVGALLLAGWVPAAAAQPAAPATVPLVRIAFPQDEGTLTPYTFDLGYPLLTLVYDTLLWRDQDGVPQPWLARSVDVGPDGRRLTVKLADGARWQDGPPVTSADVAFTFRYLAEHPHARFTPPLRVVDGVDTPDPSTAVVRLSQRSPGFLDQALADVPILPQHLWAHLPPEATAPAGLAVGSGPYRLVDHQPGVRYRLAADPTYFRGRPAVDTIEVDVIDSAESTFEALERGAVDMVPVALSPDDAARLEDAGATVTRGASYAGIALLMNLRLSPFDRPGVRAAVSQALDLTRVRRAVGGGAAADRGYVHPSSPWAPPAVLHRFDPAAATPVLAGTVPAGQELPVLVADNDPAQLTAAHEVAGELSAAGLASAVQRVRPADLSKALGQDGSTPTFGLAVGPVPALVSYDPDALHRLFGADPRDRASNVTGYTSPAFEAAAARVATAASPGDRAAATVDELTALARDAPAVPLVFPDGAFAFRPHAYDGWVDVKGSGILDKRSFVEPARPAPPPARPAATSAVVAQGGSGGPPYGGLALGTFGLAAVLAAFGLRRR
ncbi:MAG: ABC transporter substrate-binding protein [Acidimicrobiales bacterium]